MSDYDATADYSGRKNAGRHEVDQDDVRRRLDDYADDVTIHPHDGCSYYARAQLTNGELVDASAYTMRELVARLLDAARDELDPADYSAGERVAA